MAHNKPKQNSKVGQLSALDSALSLVAPTLARWLINPEDFREIRIKMSADGSYLAIAKGFDAAGGWVICFGTGFTPIQALVGLDGTMQAGHWKVDKPWSDRNKK